MHPTTSPRSPRTRARTRAARPLALCSLLLAGGCLRLRTEGAPGFDLEGLDAYAWRSPPHLSSTPGAIDDERLLERLVQAVDRGFEKRGIRKAEGDGARFLVDAHLEVAVKLQSNDPYYSLYVAEQYEEGTLAIELFDAGGIDRLWLGECRHRLRYVSRMLGGTLAKFIPIPEEREWRIEEMVERILAELPPKGSSRP